MANVELVVLITEAIVALHNFPVFDLNFTRNEYCPASFVENYSSWGIEKGRPTW